MKKTKLTALLVSIVMVIAMLPMSAFAYTREDNIIRIGKCVLESGYYLANNSTTPTTTKPTYGGYAYYKDGELTLKNFEYTTTEGEYIIITYYPGDLVINLIGENTINATEKNDIISVYSGSLTMHGSNSATLNVSGARTVVETDNVNNSFLGSPTSHLNCDNIVFNLNDFDSVLQVYGDATFTDCDIYATATYANNYRDNGLISDDTAGLMLSGDLSVTRGTVDIQAGFTIASANATFDTVDLKLSDRYDMHTNLDDMITMPLLACDEKITMLNVTADFLSSDRIISAGSIEIADSTIDAKGYGRDGACNAITANESISITDSDINMDISDVSNFYSISIGAGGSMDIHSSNIDIIYSHIDGEILSAPISGKNGLTITDSELDLEGVTLSASEGDTTISDSIINITNTKDGITASKGDLRITDSTIFCDSTLSTLVTRNEMYLEGVTLEASVDRYFGYYRESLRPNKVVFKDCDIDVKDCIVGMSVAGDVLMENTDFSLECEESAIIADGNVEINGGTYNIVADLSEDSTQGSVDEMMTAIKAGNDVSISNADVTLKSSQLGIFSNEGVITIDDDADVDINAGQYGIYYYGDDFVLDGGDLNIKSGYVGIATLDGGMAFNDGNVTIESDSYCLYKMTVLKDIIFKNALVKLTCLDVQMDRYNDYENYAIYSDEDTIVFNIPENHCAFGSFSTDGSNKRIYTTILNKDFDYVDIVQIETIDTVELSYDNFKVGNTFGDIIIEILTDNVEFYQDELNIPVQFGIDEDGDGTFESTVDSDTVIEANTAYVVGFLLYPNMDNNVYFANYGSLNCTLNGENPFEYINSDEMLVVSFILPVLKEEVVEEKVTFSLNGFELGKTVKDLAVEINTDDEELANIASEIEVVVMIDTDGDDAPDTVLEPDCEFESGTKYWFSLSVGEELYGVLGVSDFVLNGLFSSSVTNNENGFVINFEIPALVETNDEPTVDEPATEKPVTDNSQNPDTGFTGGLSVLSISLVGIVALKKKNKK